MVENEMFGRIPKEEKQIVPGKKNGSKLSNAIQFAHELVFGLAFFQFLFLYIPYGFINIAGINLPYTNIPFILAFVMMLVLTGIILGIFTFIIYKAQKKSIIFEGTNISTKETMITSAIAYLTAAINFWLFFININGWQSEFFPVTVYFLGILMSGLLSIIGLSSIYVSRKSVNAGLGLILSLVIVGASYLLTHFEFEWLLVANASIVLIIPPLLSIVKNGQYKLPIKNISEDLVPKIAWFEKALERPPNRAKFENVIGLSVIISTSNLFATLIYLKIPFPNFEYQALSFFIGAAIGVIIFITLFKNKRLDIPIFLGTGLSLVNLALMEIIPRFGNNVLSSLISGFCLGTSLSMLIRYKEKRASEPKVQDSPGSRLIELFYGFFVAVLFGLLYNVTLTLMAIDPELPETPLPARLIFQGVLIFLVVMNLLSLNASKTRLTRIEKGVIKETRASSMEDFIKAKKEASELKKKKKKKGGGMVDTMAAVMGSGPPPDSDGESKD